MTDERRPAVLVMATVPGAGLGATRLVPLLGRHGCAQLERALVGRAVRWASAVGPVSVAYTPADRGDELAEIVPDAASTFAQQGDTLGDRLVHAFERVASQHDGPVAVVGTSVPTLGRRHAAAVADDMRNGVDVTFGPATAGSYYLLAAARYHPALFALEAAAWEGPDVLDLTIRSVLGAGLSTGWLRWERDLREPGDVAALLADPCAPEEVAAALRRSGSSAR